MRENGRTLSPRTRRPEIAKDWPGEADAPHRNGASSHREWEFAAATPDARREGSARPSAAYSNARPWVRNGRHECAPDPPGRPAAGAGATHSLFPRKARAHAIPHKWGATATARPPVGSDTRLGFRPRTAAAITGTDAGPKGFSSKLEHPPEAAIYRSSSVLASHWPA
jgi:hypothetical protein